MGILNPMESFKKMVADMGEEVMNSPDFKKMKGLCVELAKTIDRIDANTRDALDRLDALEKKIEALSKKK